MASLSARIRHVVSVANANKPNRPAPPNMPAPMPARLPLALSSTFASSTSCCTSNFVWSLRRRVRSANEASPAGLLPFGPVITEPPQSLGQLGLVRAPLPEERAGLHGTWRPQLVF